MKVGKTEIEKQDPFSNINWFVLKTSFLYGFVFASGVDWLMMSDIFHTSML
jgi:hypothetical protein